MSNPKPKVLLFGSLSRTPLGRSWIEQSIPRVEQVGWQPLPFDNLNYALEEFDKSFRALATRVKEGTLDPGVDTATLRQQATDLKIPRAVILSSIRPASGDEFIRQDSSDIVIPGVFPEQVPRQLADWLVGLVQES